MSYCRYSCMNYQCDVYCYESPMGIVIQIAKNRTNFQEDLPPLPDEKDFAARAKHFGTVRNLAVRSPIKPIGLPLDGQHFVMSDYNAAADKLIDLQKMGYNVPEYAIKMLREDAQLGCME